MIQGNFVLGGSTSSSTAEPGGPGMVYFDGPAIRNLRVDNRCQQPKVCALDSTLLKS